MALHSKLKKRYVLNCKLTTLEPVRVGIGRVVGKVAEVDLPILENKRGKPVIPGSTLKGVLRSHLTRLLNSLDPQTREM